MLPELRTSIPGPRSRELGALLQKYENRNVTYVGADFPVFWERAEGTSVWDVDGNRFLDLTAGFAVSAHGHTNDRVRDAMVNQSRRLIHAMGDVHPTEAKALLCRRLSEISFERWRLGPAKTTLCNAGFEAVEVALKTSLLHSAKPGVIAFQGGYHGLGYGALEVAGIPWFRAPFRQHLREYTSFLPYPSCFRCPFDRVEGHRLEGSRFPNCSSSCLQAIESRMIELIRQRPIGCVIVEPCQGRGGEIVPPLDFLLLLRQICDTYKILLVFDEIYTGFNRTGTLFAADQFGVYPDLLCVGKGLTSGFPLSACIGRTEIMDAWPESAGEALHTSTFLGNPVGCAMALASIELHLDDRLPKRVRALGRYFKERLKSIDSPMVGDIRGIGLMIGLELGREQPDAQTALQTIRAGLRDGLIFLAGGPASSVLSFTPPFTITEEEIDYTCEKLRGYLRFGSIS
jgi:4-aminobutyrate aminotransferase-like enzyme